MSHKFIKTSLLTLLISISSPAIAHITDDEQPHSLQASGAAENPSPIHCEGFDVTRQNPAQNSEIIVSDEPTDCHNHLTHVQKNEDDDVRRAFEDGNGARNSNLAEIKSGQ